MTLSQRLTRAGLSFIVFGTAVSLMPTNGMAFSATDNCTVPTQKDYVGNSVNDTALTYSIAGTTAGSTLVLNSYNGSLSTGSPIVVDGDPINFSTMTGSGTVTTKRITIGMHSETVTATFSDGHVVTYTVTAN